MQHYQIHWIEDSALCLQTVREGARFCHLKRGEFLLEQKDTSRRLADSFSQSKGALQVRTVDGRMVWRRRHYRVRRAKQPGTFNFSVLDNGVISKEYWR